MQSALVLARRGIGKTSPNPAVGAVLHSRGERIAEGFHARFGGPHAERRLLASLAGRRVPSRAVLCLTLEPCAHHGKTPPCVEALLASRIQRFVIATADPNPTVRGRGIRALRADGREVRVGLLAREARELNAPFFIAHTQGRARVSLKIASSLDGMLADFEGHSRWITGGRARRAVGRLRAIADAVVVGRGTVEKDDPRLRATPGNRYTPTRIVIDSRLAIEPGCRLARIWRREVGSLPRDADEGERVGNWVPRWNRVGGLRWVRRPRLIAVTADPPAARRSLFLRSGWEVWDLPGSGGHVDLLALARRASREGLHDLLVEPGPRLAAGFLSVGPVDRILMFVSPRILGGDRGWTGHLGPLPLKQSLRIKLGAKIERFGEDLLIQAIRMRARGSVQRGRGRMR